MEGITDTYSSLSAVVPYNDSYDHEVPDVFMSFINDPHPNPTLDALLDGGLVPSPAPLQYQLPQCDNEIQDFPMSPMWHSGNHFNEGDNSPNSVPDDQPSQYTGGDGGEGELGFDQNPGSGFGSNVMPPPPPNSISCCGCQVLREIVHFNSNYIMTLEIHGRLGSICHAVQETRANYLYDSTTSSEPRYQNFDFCNKGIEEVKQFLKQYCLERKMEGYIIQQDPLQAFYQTLCVGMHGEWDDILSYPDEFIPEDLDTADDFIPPNLERAEEMEQPVVDEASVDARAKQGPRLPRYSLAEQRERAAKMKLDDLRAYFHLTIEEASEQLRFCPTVVKRICRKFGVCRWPARKIKSIEKRVSSLRPLLNSYSDSTKIHVAAEIGRLEREVAQLVQ